MLRVVEKDVEREEESSGSLLDELAREGARQMLVKALETEVATYLAAAADERDENGHAGRLASAALCH